MTAQTPIVRSCGFLIVRGRPIKSFLLMIHPTRYDLPKGHVDKGETDIECALRELREETGIGQNDIEIDNDFRFTLRYQVKLKKTNGTRGKDLVIFLGHLLRQVAVVPTEHESFEWRRWAPPHSIQRETIDPLLAYLEHYLRQK